MEEDLKRFLLARDVPEEDIIHMQRDKVDKAVLAIMTDEQLAKYITSYGDRVAVLSFCQQTKSGTDKETLLQNLRDKIGARKIRSKTKGAVCGTSEGMARHRNTAGEKTSRKIEIGWLHLRSDEYYQVRTRNGGGTRHATVGKTMTVAHVLETGKRLFFPDGNSTKGRAEDFSFHVCDFKRNQIPLDVTVGKLYEQTQLKLLRFYICTKDNKTTTTVQSSSEVDECGEGCSSEDVSVHIIEKDSQLTQYGSHSNSDDLMSDLVDDGDSSETDTTEQNHSVMPPRPNNQKSDCETVTTQSRGQSLPMHSTPTNTNELVMGQQQDTESSDQDDKHLWNQLHPNDFHADCCEAIYLTDVVYANAPQLQPQHTGPETLEFVPTFEEADTIIWNPEENLVREDDDDEVVVITMNYVNNEDFIQNADLSGLPILGSQPPLSSENDLLTSHTQSSHEEANQIVQDTGMNTFAQDLLLSSSSQLTPSSSDGNSGNPESIRRVSVHRIKVVEDLLAVFMHGNIMTLTLKMDFVNENAIDESGVSREVYTAFWEQFLEQCEGETERVPRLRPDFGEAEWQAVGQIWVKGLLDHGVIPVRLSNAFILACIHGIDSVDVDILMTSFLNYLPPVERSAVEKALQGTMDESDEEDLLDLFTRMGSHFLPPKNDVQSAIETMAHKAILQEPKYIVDCFSTPMAHVQLELPDKKSVLSLYLKKKATGKRVAQLFETTVVMLSQREQTTLNHLQRYVKNSDETKAEKILRFCTGSSVICVEKILVCFNAETGLNRRPVAHTCGATLEVPCTYSSYPEFRTEFDNILSSNYFEMDII